MALITYCSKCETETAHVNGRCMRCEGIRESKELEKWKTLSIGEQLLDLHERLLKVEKGPRRLC